VAIAAKRESAIPALVVAFAACFAAQAIGASIAHSNMDWYATLQKPSFTPPAIAFPIVWTTLYVLMAIASWTFWRKAETVELRRTGVIWFGIQLLLNVAWTFAFFGLHQPGYGVVTILFLLIAILITIVVFDRASRTASLLLVPYFLWVSFAAALNAGTFLLNSGS
jgi:tryptophan-rich sensory protein